MEIDIESRFWARVNKKDNHSCWLWRGDRGGNGYGRISVNRKRILAHRLSYMLNIGSIDAGKFIHHTCSNKFCVNPNHLQQISPSENTAEFYNGW